MRMKWKTGTVSVLFCLIFAFLVAAAASAAQPLSADADAFPRSLQSYKDSDAG